MLESTRDVDPDRAISYGPVLEMSDKWDIDLPTEMLIPAHSQLNKDFQTFENFQESRTEVSLTTDYDGSFNQNSSHTQFYPGGSRVIQQFPGDTTIGGYIPGESWDPDTSDLGINETTFTLNKDQDTILAYLEVELYDPVYSREEKITMEVYSLADNKEEIQYSADSSKFILPLHHCSGETKIVASGGARFVKKAEVVEYKFEDIHNDLRAHSINVEELGYTGGVADRIPFSDLSFQELDPPNAVRDMRGQDTKTTRLFIDRAEVYRFISTKVKKVFVFEVPTQNVEELNQFLDQSELNVYRIGDLRRQRNWSAVAQVEENKTPYTDPGETHINLNGSTTFSEGNVASLSVVMVPVEYWKVWKESLPLEVDVIRGDVVLSPSVNTSKAFRIVGSPEDSEYEMRIGHDENLEVVFTL